MSLVFIALKSTSLLLLNNTATLCYINFYASIGKQIQSDNSGKNHEATVIKYLVQQIKTLEKGMKSYTQDWKIVYAFSLSTKIFWRTITNYALQPTCIPNLSIFLILCDFISPFVVQKLCGGNQQENQAVNLSNKIWTKKGSCL